MGFGEVVDRLFVGSAYICPIFVLYSSYIHPLEWVGLMGLEGKEGLSNQELGIRNQD